jgi:hypothetical protein
MSMKIVPRIWHVVAVSMLATGASASGAAGKYRAPRTSWGDPLIQGLYNNTDVPFERSRDLGDKAFYTEQEYEALHQSRTQPASQRENRGAAATAADVHYDTSEFGLDVDQNDMVKSLRTSIITRPANGRLPALTREAQQRSDAARAAGQERQYDSAQDRPLAERCVIWPHEGPPLRPVGCNTLVRIMQAPGYVVFETEMIHDARIIPILDKRPGLWDVSWGGEFPMELTDGTMFEYACHEGNYGIANTLRGAREEERMKVRQGK